VAARRRGPTRSSCEVGSSKNSKKRHAFFQESHQVEMTLRKPASQIDPGSTTLSRAAPILGRPNSVDTPTDTPLWTRTAVAIPRQSRGLSILEPLKAAGPVLPEGASRWRLASAAARTRIPSMISLAAVTGPWALRSRHRECLDATRQLQHYHRSPPHGNLPSAIRTSGIVNLLLPPRQSRGGLPW